MSAARHCSGGGGYAPHRRSILPMRSKWGACHGRRWRPSDETCWSRRRRFPRSLGRVGSTRNWRWGSGWEPRGAKRSCLLHALLFLEHVLLLLLLLLLLLQHHGTHEKQLLLLLLLLSSRHHHRGIFSRRRRVRHGHATHAHGHGHGGVLHRCTELWLWQLLLVGHVSSL